MNCEIIYLKSENGLVYEFNFQLGKSLVKRACTDMLQTWHHPPKMSKTEKLEKIRISDYVPKSLPDPQAIPDIPDGNTTNKFLNGIINRRMIRNITRNRSTESVTYFHDHSYITNHEITLLNQINDVSPQNIIEIESMTRLQSKSSSWKDIRTSRLTASVAHQIVQTGL